jgi:hypothetical protein
MHDPADVPLIWCRPVWARPGIFVGLAATCAVLLAAGCGGGSKQTAEEPVRAYKLTPTDLTFKEFQSVARPAKMRIAVRNDDTKTAPDVAVTLDSFYYTEKYPELAANKRPVWIVEQGPGTPPQAPVQSQAISPPGGGQTAYVNTWALGPLKPKQEKVFEWKVVPVKSGYHRIHFKISAGLGGQATTTSPLAARFGIHIAPAPPSTHVDPSTGKVVAGQFPSQP